MSCPNLITVSSGKQNDELLDIFKLYLISIYNYIYSKQ